MVLQKKDKKLVGYLFAFVVFMFGFGFMLVPIYNTLCKSLGINGKAKLVAAAKSAGVDESRIVTVEFLTNHSGTLPWKFYSASTKVKVHPGEMKRVSFFAENETDHKMVVQSIPSITPGIAAKHFKKTECFCFTEQTLEGKQKAEMPLLFHLDRDLPKNIKTVTLSYTMYDVSQRQS